MKIVTMRFNILLQERSSTSESFDRDGQRASNSSKKITQGAEAAALVNTILTALSLSPTYLFNNSGPLTEMKLQ